MMFVRQIGGCLRQPPWSRRKQDRVGRSHPRGSGVCAGGRQYFSDTLPSSPPGVQISLYHSPKLFDDPANVNAFDLRSNSALLRFCNAASFGLRASFDFQDCRLRTGGELLLTTKRSTFNAHLSRREFVMEASSATGAVHRPGPGGRVFEQASLMAVGDNADCAFAQIAAGQRRAGGPFSPKLEYFQSWRRA